MSPLDLA